MPTSKYAGVAFENAEKKPLRKNTKKFDTFEKKKNQVRQDCENCIEHFFVLMVTVLLI